MTYRRKTTIILITVILVLIGWDVFVWMTPEENDMISHVALDFFRTHPIVAVIIGMLLGHLFWPQRIKDEDEDKK